MIRDRMSSISKSTSLSESSKCKPLKSNGLMVSKARSTLVTSRKSTDQSPTSSSSTSTGLKSSTDKGSPKVRVSHGSKSIPNSPKLQDPRRLTISPPLDKDKAKPVIRQKTQENGQDYEEMLKNSEEEVRRKEEQVILLEKEKSQITLKLNHTQKYAEESDEKLTEALTARKRASDDLEIEKFRSTEIEQAGIEKLQRMEELWEAEMAAVKTRHAVDASALLSATRDLENMKEVSKIATAERDRALALADDTARTSETYSRKLQLLSTEAALLKSSFDSKLKTVEEANRKTEAAFSSRIVAMAADLETAAGYKKKYEELEASMDRFKATVEGAVIGESRAHDLVAELERKVEELNMNLRDVDAKNVLIREAETEISSLKQKVGLLEATVEQYGDDIFESDNRASRMEAKVRELNHQLGILKERNSEYAKEEKTAASYIDELLQEIGHAKREEEESRAAIESLTSALVEVSAQSREAGERLGVFRKEKADLENKIENIETVLNSVKDGHATMAADAKHHMASNEAFVEISKLEFVNRRSEWERFEGMLTRSESEAAFLKNSLEAERSEKKVLRESILEKDAILSRVSKERVDLQEGQIVYAEKVADLTRRLEQALLVDEDRVEITVKRDSDYDLLSKINEFENFSNTESDSKKEDKGGFQMWESCRIGGDEEAASPDDGERLPGAEAEGERKCEQRSGELNKQSMMAKRNPLLARFGSILKKKKSNSHNLR